MSQKTNRKYSRQTIADNSRVAVRRDADTNKTYIDFYAAVFNQRSRLIREWGEVFYEIIDRHAFDAVLADPGLNCIHTVDHIRIKMLGRTSSGTLTLVADDYGLKGTIEMPDTNLGRDMVEMIERGDYKECSFIYTIADKGVQYDRSEEIPVRTVTNVLDLFDTSFVIDGAFANTNIKKRFASDYETPEFDPTIEPEPDNSAAEGEHDILKRELEIIGLKTK